MKKLLSFILLFIFTLSFSSCGNVELTSQVKVITPYGTPYLAIGGLINTENVKIDAVNGAAGVQAALVSGEYDIVIAPINLAANLYNKGNSKYQIEAVLTMNNAYVVTDSSNKLDSTADLVSKELFGFGAIGIPGKVFAKVLKEAGISAESVDWTMPSSTAVYASYVGESNRKDKYYLMSEPDISRLIVNNKMEIKTLDLAKELGQDVPQACILVNPNSSNQENIEGVLKLIQNNVKDLNKNPEEYAHNVVGLDRTFEAMKEDVIAASLPKSNIVYKQANKVQEEINNILSMLGVDEPNEGFYR